MPSELSHSEKEITLAFKEMYKCEGISSRQHNEPSGNQDVWYYHLHVFPRYKNDDLYKTDREDSKPEERIEYANKIRKYFIKREIK